MGWIANDPNPAPPDLRAIEAELFGDPPAPDGGTPGPVAPAGPVGVGRTLPLPDYAAAVAARAAAEASAAAAVAARGQLERFLTGGEPLTPVAGPPEPLVMPAATPAPTTSAAAWAPVTDDAVPMLVSELVPDATVPPVAPPVAAPVPAPVARPRPRPVRRPERPLDPALEAAYFASVPLDDPDGGRRPPVRRMGQVATHRSRWRLRFSLRRGGTGG